jgi:hypothetical protein
MTIFHYVSSFSLNSKKYIKWTISYAFNSDTNIIESLLSEGKLSIEVFEITKEDYIMKNFIVLLYV